MPTFRCAEEWTTHQPSSRCVLIPGLVKQIWFWTNLLQVLCLVTLLEIGFSLVKTANSFESYNEMFDFWGNRSRPKLMIWSLLLSFETLSRLSEHSNLSFQTCRHLKMWSIKNVSTRTKRGRRTLCSSLRRTRRMPSFASFRRCVSSLPFSKSYQCLFYDSSYEPYKPSVMMRGLPDEEGFVQCCQIPTANEALLFNGCI